MTADRIARLKITLDDVKPQVLRRIEVPLTIRLDRLHEVLQAALGWTNSHLYELRAQDVGWGIPDPGFGTGPLDARKAKAHRRTRGSWHQRGCAREALQILRRLDNAAMAA